MPIITPIQAPAAPAAQASQSAQDARSRAIAMLSGAQPVVDANNISAEEAGALKPTSGDDSEGQNNTTETPSDKSQEEAKPKDEALSPQFAMLARKEKALRQKAQAQDATFRQQEAAMAAREQAIKAKESEYSEGYIAKDRFQADPWAALNELGLSYEQLTQLAINQPQENPQQKAALDELRAEIKALKDTQTSNQQAQADQQTAAYKQAVAQIRNEAQSLVASNPDFETIHETGSVGDVVDLIEQHFKETQQLMTVEEAAKLVEEHLIEEALKIARIKKIQTRLQPAKPTLDAAAQKQAETAGKQPQQHKTLTNAMGQSGKMSARDRAVLAFKGELK